MCSSEEPTSCMLELEIVKRGSQNFLQKKTNLVKKKPKHRVKKTSKINKNLNTRSLKYRWEKLETKIYLYKDETGSMKYKWEKLETKIYVYKDERHLNTIVKKDAIGKQEIKNML
ncbi:UNVERIFIED_CONTAM: hypothetical protein K2H54_010737 [Gekko kuhli]